MRPLVQPALAGIALTILLVTPILRGDHLGEDQLEDRRLLRTLLAEPYLSVDEAHQGLILHSVYHRPNGWDHVPNKGGVPSGESVMWGDYHLLEAALYLNRLIEGGNYYTFWAVE